MRCDEPRRAAGIGLRTTRATRGHVLTVRGVVTAWGKCPIWRAQVVRIAAAVTAKR